MFSAFGAEVSLGTPATEGNGLVSIPINYTAVDGETAAGIQMDIELDSTLFSTYDILPGTVVDASGKEFAFSLIGESTFRVMIVGLNQNSLENGALAELQLFSTEMSEFTVDACQLSNVIASGPNGNEVSVQIAGAEESATEVNQEEYTEETNGTLGRSQSDVALVANAKSASEALVTINTVPFSGILNDESHPESHAINVERNETYVMASTFSEQNPSVANTQIQVASVSSSTPNPKHQLGLSGQGDAQQVKPYQKGVKQTSGTSNIVLNTHEDYLIYTSTATQLENEFHKTPGNEAAEIVLVAPDSISGRSHNMTMALLTVIALVTLLLNRLNLIINFTRLLSRSRENRMFLKK